MIWRAGITVAAWLIGLLFLTTNGQYFTHGLLLMIAAVMGALPWLSFLRRGRSDRERSVAVAIAVVSALIAVKIAFDLPEAYEKQRQFNNRADRDLATTPR